MSRRIRDMTDAELSQYMQGVGEATTTITPEGSAFVVLIFEDTGHVQYVSNAIRGDIVKAMRECADRIERRQDNSR